MLFFSLYFRQVDLALRVNFTLWKLNDKTQ
jgi:hypothetical protein